MKNILAVAIAIIICILMIWGLSSLPDVPAETISNTKTHEITGNYFLYRTTNSQEYLTFLENFDEEKFEIIDISTSMEAYKSGEFYIITYREKK